MATTYTYLVGGDYDAGTGKNLWEVTDDGTTLSVTDSWLVSNSATPNVVALAKDLDGNFYIGLSNNFIAKYSATTMTLDTSWGTSGYIDAGQPIHALTCGFGNELIVARDESGVPDVTVRYYNSAGVLVWAKDIQTGATEFTDKVMVDASGNVVGTGSRQSTGFTGGKYAIADGSTLQTYWQAGGAYNGFGLWVHKNQDVIMSAYPVSAPYTIWVRKMNKLDVQQYLVSLTGSTSTGECLTVDDDEEYTFLSVVYKAGEDNLFRLNNSDGTGQISCNTGGTITGNGMEFNKDGHLVVGANSDTTDEYGNTATLRVMPTDLSSVYRSISSASVPSVNAISIRPSASVAPQLDTMKTYSKALVAVANNEVWYESTPGVMTELTDANGDIDTSNVFSMVEAYQKVFIANKSNRKVADFANTKLSTADAGVTACTKGAILTGGSSGASMVVDYVDGVTDDAAMLVYGFRTTSATFTSGETVTGDGGQSFVLDAAEDAPPHWYNWTPFGLDSSSYGSLPSQAYISCLYRGRLVLAGHNHYPHMWWMSKVDNPWDWLYDSTDPLSAVAGNNVDAGEIGDIIRAMIPYGDDFLIFGCANSLWIMRGDPVESGSIDKLDDTIGMFSPWSWCQDSQMNTYFFGTGGFWKIARDGMNLINLSFNKIPDLCSDWAVDPALHRITVMYDPQRHGIVLSKITLATGANTGYFYSLITEGFYPESYPNEAAPFSGFYYEADDPDYKHLVVGCADGKLRYFKDTQKSDSDTTSGDSAVSINSWFTLSPQKLMEDDNREGIANNFCFTVGGGASGSTYKNSDGFSYEMHVADDAETLAENVLDGATARESGTFSTTGRQNRIRKRVRGLWFTIKCYNSTLNETWCVNKITFDIKPAGNK